MKKQNESVIAHSLHRQLLLLKNQLGNTMFAIAEILKNIKDNQLWLPLGYENFSEYVRSPEIGFNSRTAYYYIQIYEVFVKRLKMNPEQLEGYSYDRLRKLAPIIIEELESSEDSQEIQQIMDDAISLRWYDFEKVYKDKKENEGFEDYLETPEFFRCSCHKKWIIAVPVTDLCPDFMDTFYELLKKRRKKE